MKFKIPIIPFALIFALLFSTWAEAFEESTPGFYLAAMEEQMKNPEKMLMGTKVRPSDAAVREYNWIIETLQHRCTNKEEILVSTILGSWRIVTGRGYKVPLLNFARELLDFSGIAFQSRRNQKFDFQKAALKWIKDKYPIKKQH